MMTEDESNIEANEQEGDLGIQSDATSQDAQDLGKKYYDQLVHLTADYENFKKRTVKERADFIKYGLERFMQDFLPCMDNFERALMHAKSAKDIEAIKKGLEMILHQVISVLEQHGVKAKSSLGQKFDPLIHEGVSLVDSNEHEPGIVLDEMQKAYFLHDRLLRPAMVAVSKKIDENTFDEQSDPQETPTDQEPQTKE